MLTDTMRMHFKEMGVGRKRIAVSGSGWNESSAKYLLGGGTVKLVEFRDPHLIGFI